MKRLLSATACLLVCLWLGCGTGEYENRLSQHRTVPASEANPAPAAKAASPANAGPQITPFQPAKPASGGK